jgi:hypothetical protein
VALAGLAPVGLDAVIRGRASRPAVAGATALVLGGIILSVAVPSEGPSAEYLGPRLLLTTVVVVLAGALVFLMRAPGRRTAVGVATVALLGADLWAFGFGYHTFQRPTALSPTLAEVDYLHRASGPRPRIARRKGPVLPLNGALVYGLYDIHGNDTFILNRTVALLSVAQDQTARARYQNVIFPLTPEALESPVVHLVGVTHVVAPTNVPGASDASFSRRFAVFDQPEAFPPAFLATCWGLLPGDAVLDRIRAMDADTLSATVVVEDGPAARGMLRPSTTAECPSRGAVVVERYEPERIHLVADAEARSVLVLTDAWYPGWEATIDGRPAPVLTVDHALRGVAVGAGSHRVELIYRPGWVPIGFVLSVIAALLAAGYGLGVDRSFRAARSGR